MHRVSHPLKVTIEPTVQHCLFYALKLYIYHTCLYVYNLCPTIWNVFLSISHNMPTNSLKLVNYMLRYSRVISPMLIAQFPIPHIPYQTLYQIIHLLCFSPSRCRHYLPHRVSTKHQKVHARSTHTQRKQHAFCFKILAARALFLALTFSEKCSQAFK